MQAALLLALVPACCACGVTMTSANLYLDGSHAWHPSNISGQLKETSGMKAYTARPTTGEAALPWQAIRV